MNGAHDLGGMHGFGPIAPEPDEPVFHAEWERRCFALTLACGFLGAWNIDMSRHARERMDPAEYLRTTYYEHWLHGLETLLDEQGLATREEQAAGRPADGPPGRGAGRDLRVLRAADVERTLGRGGPSRLDVELPARFAPGDRVVTRNIHPRGHTRLPRYARARRGVVERAYGVHVFADASAAGAGREPRHLYNVRFTARELWGDPAPAGDSVFLDLWEPHLEEAGAR